MPKDDLIRLRHMLDAAKEAIELAAGKSRDEIETERMLNLSLVRLIEIVGEAADHVSAEFRLNHSRIPWKEIIGMRHRLILGGFTRRDCLSLVLDRIRIDPLQSHALIIQVAS